MNQIFTRHRLNSLFSPVFIIYLFLFSSLGFAQEIDMDASIDQKTRKILELNSVINEMELTARKYEAAYNDYKRLVDKYKLDQEELNAAIGSYELSYWSYYSDRFKRISDHDQSLMDHFNDLIRWQKGASTIVLVLVAVVAVSGVAFSGYQLYISSRKGLENINTEASFEAGKFQIRTAVIGLVILSISMVYLFLFLKEVYTIKPIPNTIAEGRQITNNRAADNPRPTPSNVDQSDEEGAESSGESGGAKGTEGQQG